MGITLCTTYCLEYYCTVLPGVLLHCTAWSITALYNSLSLVTANRRTDREGRLKHGTHSNVETSASNWYLRGSDPGRKVLGSIPGSVAGTLEEPLSQKPKAHRSLMT